MNYFYSAKDANQRELALGVKLKTMWGEKIMMSLVELDPGSEVPLHSHPNEQAGMVLEGEFEFTIGTESKKVKKGEYYIIPGGIEHRVVAGSKPPRALDIFSPPRDNYKS
ncbi:MAG: Cupin domain protein [Chloroflexi bacterium]|jgi:quercetin dioxygenase-like cupin family protein|nr:MAG: Cupin domain protein [Chloroflexota bacterium]